MFIFQSRAICKVLQVLFTVLKFPANIFSFGCHKGFPRSFLVVCVAHIGDVLCLMPALHLLRECHPDAKISVLVPPSLCDFLKRSSAKFDLIPYDEKDVLLNLKLYLRTNLYDVAYVFWAKRDILLGRAIGSKEIVAFDLFKKGWCKLLVQSFYKTPEEINLERYFCSLVVEREGSIAAQSLQGLRVSGAHFFPDFSSPRDKVVILHAVCRSPNRCLPPSYWKAIAKCVQTLGYKVIFTGNGEAEREFIKRCDPNNWYQHAVGLYSLDELARKLHRSTLLVTVDTGVMHLAKFTGIKILVLCGGSEPERIAPSRFFDCCWNKQNLAGGGLFCNSFEICM